MSTLASQPPPKPLTPEDLLRLPDAVNYELVDGRLVERHVSKESSRIAAEIVRLLGNDARRTAEAEVFGADLGYQCFPIDKSRVRKPDVSVVRRERMAGLPGDPGFMPMPADLAVEVVSPNDLWHDVTGKVEEYLAAGFGAVWVVDPQRRTVSIYRPDGSLMRLRENDDIDAAPALPSFRCKVGELFK